MAIDDVFESVPAPHGPTTALVRRGAGPAVVFLHGVMADAHAWLPAAGAVVPDRRAVVVNRRGRSPSGDLGAAYDVETEVADLQEWLDLEDAPVDLVAHSYGGLVAAEAVRRGARVRSLVLYDPVCRPFGAAVLPALAGAIDADDLDAAVEIINVDLSGYDREHVQELRRGPAWDRLRELARPSAEELRAVEGFAFEDHDWSALDVPVTLLAGETSRRRPPYGPSVDRFAAALGVADVVLLAGQDHLAHVTAPEALAAAIEGALRPR